VPPGPEKRPAPAKPVAPTGERAAAKAPAKAAAPVTGIALQIAVEDALAAHDPARLQSLHSALPPSAPDEDRRAVAYGFLRLGLADAAAGRFADAHARVRTAGVTRGRSDPVVLVVSGNVSMMEARGATGETRTKLLDQAAAAYTSANRSDPRRADAVHGWGAALLASARELTGVKRDRTLALAAEKFAAAAAIDPARVESHVQWGHALVARADLLLGKSKAPSDAAVALLEEASAHYDEALGLAPKQFEVLHAASVALLRCGQLRAGAEAVAIYDAAAERFKLAARVAPKAATADLQAAVTRLWGHALVGRAREGDPADADRVRARAVEKYQEASKLSTREDLCLRYAAETLLDRAAAKQGARRVALAEEAVDAIRKASKALPEDETLFFSLARAQAMTGDAKKCVGALERWIEEAEKPTRRDLDQCPDFDDVREDERFVAFRKAWGRG
jgi:tetratricopeptide (TPR) repeat protein